MKTTTGMRVRRLAAATALAGTFALAPALADAHGGGGGAGPMMGPGMMGQGMMGPGMMGQGGGAPGAGMPGAMGPGMMGPGMMSPWMMQMMMRGMGQGMPMMGPGGTGTGPGTMGPGMMGPGMMGPGMMGPGTMGGWQGAPCPGMRKGAEKGRDLTAEDVRARLEAWLEAQGNPRLTVGDVKEKDEDTIVADIVTKEGGVLVDRFEIDRHTGAVRRVVEGRG